MDEIVIPDPKIETAATINNSFYLITEKKLNLRTRTDPRLSKQPRNRSSWERTKDIETGTLGKGAIRDEEDLWSRRDSRVAILRSTAPPSKEEGEVIYSERSSGWILELTYRYNSHTPCCSRSVLFNLLGSLSFQAVAVQCLLSLFLIIFLFK